MRPHEGRAGAGAKVELAFDTATAVGSVAVARGDEVLASAILESRSEHASRLLPAIDRVLAEAELTRSDIEAVVVGEGPGSFTGVRVAAATAKGLARGLSVPLLPVSSLAAAALAAHPGEVCYALFDARSDRVYGACYASNSQAVRELVAPHAGTIDDVLAGETPPAAIFFGDGAERHRDLIVGAGYALSDRSSTGCAALGLLRYVQLRQDLVPLSDAGEWEPEYLRPWKPGPSHAGAAAPSGP